MFNAPLTFPLDDFKGGWDCVAKPTTMEKGFFKEIKNFNITRHRGIEKRGGMTKLYPDSIFLGSGDNILTDGGLNLWTTVTDLTHWTESFTGDSTVNREATEKIEGAYSCRLDVDASNNAASIYQDHSLTPLKRYKLVVWYKNSLADKTSRIGFRDLANNIWLKEDGTWNVSAYNIILPNSLIWKKSEVYFYGHPDYSDYRLYLMRQDSASSSIYFDKVGIYDITPTKITSLYEYNAPDENSYNLVAIGTKIKAFYEAAWHDLKDGLTADKKYSFATHLGLCYGANGVDPNFKLYNNTPYQVGITPPAAAPAVAKIDPGGDSKVEEYAETNQDNCGELRQHADRTRIAQAFTLDEDADLTKVKLSLKKIGTITAGKKVWVEIHSNKTGTQVGEDSATQEANDIETSFTNYELLFSGTKPSLSKNTIYYIVLYGDFDVSSTNFIVVGFDNSSPTYDSTLKYWEINGSSVWTDYPSIDLVFELYAVVTTGIELKSFGILETGLDDSLRDVSEQHLLAQSFKLDEASKLTSIKLPLHKQGGTLPTFNFWVEIHSSKTGTSGEKNESDNIVGQASDEINGVDIDYDYSWIEFTFSGTLPSLSADTTYYIVLYQDRIGSETKFIEWTYDTSDYEDGQRHWVQENMSWIDKTYDFSFKALGYVLAGAKIEEYALGNIDIIRSLRETTSQTLMAQSIQITEESSVTRLKLWLSKVGAPVGNLWVEIHDGQEGTSGTKNASTYKVGEASSNVDVSLSRSTVTGTTIAFVSATKKITDSNNGLAGFLTGDRIMVTGSGENDGDYTIVTGGVAGEIVVSESLVDEDAGVSVTIETINKLSAFPTYGWVEFTFAGVKPPLVQGKTYYLVLYGSADVSETDYVSVGMDKIAPTYSSGVGWNVDNGSPMIWTAFEHIDLMFEIYMTVGGLTGDYKYKYCYKRTAFKDLISNPSEASDLIQPVSKNMRVSLIASTDPQVNGIILYRTLSGSDPEYYKVPKEFSNESQDYDDAFADGSLTTLLKEDNTVPPKAKFIVVGKDRVFYINCPDEENGGSLVRWSKSGIGEACPSTNRQHFDRDDGREITGGVFLGDNLIIFKKDKIGVLAGDLSQPLSCEIWYLSLGIGCIASWAILPLEDKVLFLSEEGWKATDGTDIFNISSKINGLIKDGYITINENENYSVAYYPQNEQFHFLINHSTLDPIVAVGHFIIPLMLASKGIIGISEKALGSMVGWTPHQYDNHTLTCLGNYTDGDGITRVIAGSDDGYVYLLDDGLSDDGSNIHVRLRTDWLNLGRPKTHTKVTRRGRMDYYTDGTINMEFQEDVDFKAGGSPTVFTGAGRDIDDTLNEPFDMAGVGELFRYTLSEISSQKLSINAIEIKLRDMGAR